MSLENSKRLWKHFTDKRDKVRADRVADRVRLFYDKNGNAKKLGLFGKNPEAFQDLSDSYDITAEEKTKSKGKK